jgi:hypothetical protein
VRIPLSWLRDFVDVPWAAKELGERLRNSIGFPEASPDIEHVHFFKIKKPLDGLILRLTICLLNRGNGKFTSIDFLNLFVLVVLTKGELVAAALSLFESVRVKVSDRLEGALSAILG